MLRLMEQQRVALAYLRTYDGFSLFMEQGTGKTVPTLCRLLDLVTEDRGARFLIVAPKSALGAWSRDMELFEPDQCAALKEACELVNYEKVWRGPNGGRGNAWDHPWDAIVLDEAHNIKNRASRRGKYLLRLACNARHRYALTGTPVGNGRLEDLWSLLAFMEPRMDRGNVRSSILAEAWGEGSGSYAEFERRYCLLDQWFKPYSYKRVDELQDIVADHSYRVTKAECMELPEKLPDTIVDVERAERSVYTRMARRSALVEFDLVAENPLSRLSKLRQICSGFVTDDSGEVHELRCGKPKALREALDGLGGQPVVIFAEFAHSIEAIEATLDEGGVSHVTLDGRQKNKTVWRSFQAGDVDAIVCQYRSANAGIDLFRASTIIYYEPCTSSTVMEQSRDRIHRRGQHHPCSYLCLTTEGTVEVEIWRALRGYQDFGERLFTETIDEYQRGRRGQR